MEASIKRLPDELSLKYVSALFSFEIFDYLYGLQSLGGLGCLDGMLITIDEWEMIEGSSGAFL